MIKKIREFLGLTFFTSHIDQFLAQLNQKYRKLSASQKTEADKYQRIFQMRDTNVADTHKQPMWDKF